MKTVQELLGHSTTPSPPTPAFYPNTHGRRRTAAENTASLIAGK
jgi:hypothetical protein